MILKLEMLLCLKMIMIVGKKMHLYGAFFLPKHMLLTICMRNKTNTVDLYQSIITIVLILNYKINLLLQAYKQII